MFVLYDQNLNWTLLEQTDRNFTVKRKVRSNSSNSSGNQLEIGHSLCSPNINETLMKNGIKWPECDNDFQSFLKRTNQPTGPAQPVCQAKPNTRWTNTPSEHIRTNIGTRIMNSFPFISIAPLHMVCILMSFCFAHSATENRNESLSFSVFLLRRRCRLSLFFCRSTNE